MGGGGGRPWYIRKEGWYYETFNFWVFKVQLKMKLFVALVNVKKNVIIGIMCTLDTHLSLTQF